MRRRTFLQTASAAIASWELAAILPAYAFPTPHSDPLVEVDALLGVSADIVDARRAVRRAASLTSPILLEGETGCGKAAIARAMHATGPRRDRPFRPFACAPEPADLVEALLFGSARRASLFEHAARGTVYLHEVGSLAAAVQTRLLHVIKEHAMRPDGVRVIASTPRSLALAVGAGRFRSDLLAQLAGVHIWVPPLRARREDIPALTHHYWRRHARRDGAQAVDAATLSAFARYEWPANLRELENVVKRLALNRGCARRRNVATGADEMG